MARFSELISDNPRSMLCHLWNLAMVSHSRGWWHRALALWFMVIPPGPLMVTLDSSSSIILGERWLKATPGSDGNLQSAAPHCEWWWSIGDFPGSQGHQISDCLVGKLWAVNMAHYHRQAPGNGGLILSGEETRRKIPTALVRFKCSWNVTSN